MNFVSTVIAQFLGENARAADIARRVRGQLGFSRSFASIVRELPREAFNDRSAGRARRHALYAGCFEYGSKTASVSRLVSGECMGRKTCPAEMVGVKNAWALSWPRADSITIHSLGPMPSRCASAGLISATRCFGASSRKTADLPCGFRYATAPRCRGRSKAGTDNDRSAALFSVRTPTLPGQHSPKTLRKL